MKLSRTIAGANIAKFIECANFLALKIKLIGGGLKSTSQCFDYRRKNTTLQRLFICTKSSKIYDKN